MQTGHPLLPEASLGIHVLRRCARNWFSTRVGIVSLTVRILFCSPLFRARTCGSEHEKDVPTPYIHLIAITLSYKNAKKGKENTKIRIN